MDWGQAGEGEFPSHPRSFLPFRAGCRENFPMLLIIPRLCSDSRSIRRCASAPQRNQRPELALQPYCCTCMMLNFMSPLSEVRVK